MSDLGKTQVATTTQSWRGTASAVFLVLASLLLSACSADGTVDSATDQANESSPAPTAEPVAATPTEIPDDAASAGAPCPAGARETNDGRCWVQVADASPGPTLEVQQACDDGDPALVVVGRECRRVRPEVCGSDWPVPRRRGCTLPSLDTEYAECAEYYLAIALHVGWPSPDEPSGCPDVTPWSCGELADSACTEVVATGEWSCGLGLFDVISETDGTSEMRWCGQWIDQPSVDTEAGDA